MPTDAALLTLAQWFSPSYPIGAFSYSHGLEWAAQAGDVTDGQSLKAWIEDCLQSGAGRSDALFLAAAFKAETLAQLTDIDETARAFATSRERLRETTLQGAAFARVTSDVWDQPHRVWTYPVAVGHAARLAGVPLEQTTQFYLHAFAANLVAAGQRLLNVGQTEAQSIVRSLAPLCLAISRDTAEGDLDTLSGTAFLADIAAMKHETQYSRMFRT